MMHVCARQGRSTATRPLREPGQAVCVTSHQHNMSAGRSSGASLQELASEAVSVRAAGNFERCDISLSLDGEAV